MSGPSLHVYGIIEPDEKYKNMVSAWEACMKAGIGVPDALGKYFDWETPDSEGMRILLGKADELFKFQPGVSYHSEEYESGVIIDIAKIDPRIKKIKVINQY